MACLRHVFSTDSFNTLWQCATSKYMDGSWIHFRAAGATSQCAAIRDTLYFDSYKASWESRHTVFVRFPSLWNSMTAACTANNLAHSAPSMMKSLTTRLSSAHSTAYCRVSLAGLAQIGYVVKRWRNQTSWLMIRTWLHNFISWFSFASAGLNIMMTSPHNHVWSIATKWST